MSSSIAYSPFGHSKYPYPRLNTYYIVIVLVCLCAALYIVNGVRMRSDDLAVDDDFISSLIDLSYLTVNLTNYNYAANPQCSASQNRTTKAKAEALRVEYRECSEHILLRFWGDDKALLVNFPTTLYVCDQERNLQHIPIQPFSYNGGELTFWAALPNCKDDSNLLVKVGEPTKADELLRKRVGNLTVHKIGRYVRNHKKYFLDLKGKKPELLLDMMWVNQRYDFPYDRFINEGQFFAKNNITICQVMVKVAGGRRQHPDDALRFRSYFERGHIASKFITLRAGIEKYGVTTYLILNTFDQRCIDKYLP